MFTNREPVISAHPTERIQSATAIQGHWNGWSKEKDIDKVCRASPWLHTEGQGVQLKNRANERLISG